MKLGRDFYRRDSLKVARELLGKNLVHKIDGETLVARIVETEAYLGIDDKACHSYGGRRTERTETMYGDAGLAYVYLIYGIYNCFNITTVGKDIPEAVLIRAVEPISNLDIVVKNRFNKSIDELTSYERKNISNGPGKLSMAYRFDRSLDGRDMTGDSLYVEDQSYEDFKIVESRRIGIDYAEEARDFLYRFYIEGNPFVSQI